LDRLPTVNVKKDNSRPTSSSATSDTSERRRIGKIVRDERDTATVEWLDAPVDYERAALSLESTLPPGTKRPQFGGYDPYQTVPAKAKAKTDAKPAKRDLRKLSEWIKQMRDLEERKKRGDE
jgi:hypothetical protein